MQSKGKQSKKRVQKGLDNSPAGQGRERVDSILGNKMDEYYNYERMQCVADVDKKWCKFNKLVQGDASSKVVLIAVPKNFDINQLNHIEVDGSVAKPFDLKKRIQKAETKGTSHVKGFIEAKKNPCIMEIHAGNKFEESTHLRQIVTLLPKI